MLFTKKILKSGDVSSHLGLEYLATFTIFKLVVVWDQKNHC